MPPKRPALFLDRDGVINREINYLHRPQDLELIPGAAEAIAHLNRCGIPVVLISNQAGIGRGLFSEEDFWEVQKELSRLLQKQQAHLDGVFFCPHHPQFGIGPYRIDCSCRKPKPGLLVMAALRLDLELTRSVMVGDKISDLEAALAAGCRPILVRTGYGRASERELAAHPQHQQIEVYDDLYQAVQNLGEYLSTTNHP